MVRKEVVLAKLSWRRGARCDRSSAWRAGGSARVEPRAVAAALTLLLHVAVVAAFVRVTVSAGEPPKPSAAEERGADSLRDAGERIVSVEIRPSLATRGLACAGSTYIGVGITADPRTQRIILVGDDTPAARAGLRHDDIVLNPDVWSDAHREGVVLRVLVLREGFQLIVPVRVGWICIG